jgi:hypothetical protein
MSGVEKHKERFVCLLIRLMDLPPRSFTFGAMYLMADGSHSLTFNTTGLDILSFGFR